MLYLVDRRRRDDRFLEWKVWIFSVAAALVIVGIATDARWMTGTALVLLLCAMLLRFLPGRGGGSGGLYGGEEDAEHAEDEEDDPV